MSQINTKVTAGSLGSVVTLQGNTGPKVPPDGTGNINVIGGVGITVDGDAGLNTLTIDATNTYEYTEVNASPYVVAATDQFIGVDTLGGAITIRLPNLPDVGRSYMIKDIFGNAGTNNITITTVGGITLIDGLANYTMNVNFASVQIIFSGVFYAIF